MKFDKTYVPRTNLGGDYNVNIQYLYKADGSKLRKTYTFGFGPTNTQTATQTDYLDGFQYEATSTNGKFTMILKFVPTAEGYYDFEKNKYFYSYTDHLGNVRLSYFKNAGGSAEVLEENNFYPFGLKHEGYNAQTGNPSYNYQYNGKELQKETGWSDYGARMYMSDIGRWGVIDPLAETGRRFSPYNYAYNNPIRYIDPDGRKPMSSEDEERNIMQKNAPDGSLWFTYANGEHGAGGGDGMGDFFAQMNRRHGGGGGSAATFGETAAYTALMSGQTSNIVNVNGRLQWYTLDNPENSMYNDFDGLLTGYTGGITLHSVKVSNDNSTPWSAYKDWADWGSTAVGGGFEYIAKQRTALYNNGYWIDNLGNMRSVRYAGRAVDSQIGLRSNYLLATAKYGKYAKRAGYVGYAINAGQIAYGVYEDKGKFGKNAQVATAGVGGGLAGAAGGAWALGKVGGAIGTFIGPEGTAIGGAIGGIVGGFWGGEIAEGLADDLLK